MTDDPIRNAAPSRRVVDIYGIFGVLWLLAWFVILVIAFLAMSAYQFLITHINKTEER